ncbi:MAG: 30S ribosomal protein S11 [Candidatus Pacebacteria bacterium]|nr:30S ribosomal protein S11 [Candidatus Paceibacterota bacterium]
MKTTSLEEAGQKTELAKEAETVKDSADKKSKTKVLDDKKKVKSSVKKEDLKNELDEEEETQISLTSDDEDLPEEIKKKLEQNKAARAKKKIVKKRKKKTTAVKVKVGKAFIQATYNNTIVSLTDLQGNVISWASAGVAGFKGAKKATPYAASIIVKIAAMKAKEEFGLQEVSVFVSGVGTGRESAVRALNANGLEVTSIKDITPVPHNGCRPKKPRRV